MIMIMIIIITSLVGAFSVIMNLRMDLFKALMPTHLMLSLPMLSAKFFQAFLAL